MKKLVLQRALLIIPMLFLVSLATFSLTYIMPGSPAAAILGSRATPESIAALEDKLGLNEPFLVRYIQWLGHAFTGDLGVSFQTNRPVTDMISVAVLPTVSLAVGAMLVAIIVGFTAGTLAALQPGSLVDRSLAILTAIGLAIPEFWLGVILILIFAVGLGWAPVISWVDPARDVLGWAHGLVLPSLALGIAGSALIARQMRSAMLETLDAPYIQMLRAVGTPKRTIVTRFALKNALVPVITVCGFLFVSMVGASFVIEQVFAMPGLGTITLKAVGDRDIPVIQGVTLAIAVVVAIVYLTLDIAYGLLNPKTRPQ